MKNLTQSQKTKAKKQIGELVLKEIEKQTFDGISPVSGRKFKSLTNTQYKNIKKRIAGNTDANLHLNNDMIASTTHRPSNKGVWFELPSGQAGKSHNHNTKKTKKSTSPKRQFIPDDKIKKGVGGNFNSNITKKIDNVIKSIRNASKDNN